MAVDGLRLVSFETASQWTLNPGCMIDFQSCCCLAAIYGDFEFLHSSYVFESRT